MTTSAQYNAYAQAALAAYATSLVAGVEENNTGRYTDTDVGMAPAQAAAFNAGWAVLQQSTSTNGFSAVLLQRKDEAGNATGEKVLAIAGTDRSSLADLITDLVNIAQYGTVLGMPQYASLEAFHQQLVSSGLLNANEQVVLTGHSLGGFLAQAFTARHSNAVSATYTYNAPGFGSMETLLGFLGITDSSAAAKITNVHATDGPSFVAGLGVMLGASQGVRIEADASNPTANHSMVGLGDALAVQNAFAILQPTLTTSQIEARFIASGYRDRRLEDTLDALRTVFIDPASNDINKTPTGDRDRFYANLYALQNDVDFNALSGQVQLVQANPGFASAARASADTALAYRYALLELLPLAVVANTDAQNQTLYGAYVQRLSLYDSATGTGNLTEQWLADRAATLDWLVVRNKSGATGPITGGISGRTIVEAVNYELREDDGTLGTQLLVGAVDQMNQRRQVMFGGDAADTLDGYGRVDHLYGGAGDDTLNGLGGADYLEGNADNDTLDGGEGNDTLLGGTGYDTYVFTGAWGADTVIDADGSGAIQVEGLQTLDGADAEKAADGVWQTDDRRVNYSLVAVDAGRDDLIVSFSDRTDIVRIRNWTSGALGITLSDTPFAPATTDTFIGEIVKATSGNDYLTTPNGYSSAGAQADAPDVLNGGSAGDLLQGLGGNDGISGGAGDDVIEGGDGADLLLGGEGADTINGGAGNDFIFGSASGQIDRPDRVDFTPPSSSGTELARGFSWVAYAPAGDDAIVIAGTSGIAPNGESTGNVIDGGAGDDHIFAGSGADIVHGGDDNDSLSGLGGADVLYGDAGNDKLFGDGKQGADAGGAYTASAEHGNDILVGGAGNDTLAGQGGDDELYGGADDDTLFGDDTDLTDTPVSIHGNDWLDGGDGVDFLHGGGRDDVLYGGAGNDSLWGDSGKGVGQAGYIDGTYQGDDFLDGEDGDDYLQGEGGSDILFGGSGDDTLVGDSDEADLAIAYHGNDVLDGGAGDDILVGQGGADTLDGGDGADSLYGDGQGVAADHQGDDFLDGGAANDWLEGGGGGDSLFGGSGNDELHGDAAEAELAGQYHGDDYLDGGDGDDRLWGHGGDDTLLGGAGNDYLDGDGSPADVAAAFHGDDTLDGGDGNDTLLGGGGNDLLIGGAGHDTLSGGAGDDTYRIAADEAGVGLYRDTIYDTQGDDVLELDGVALASLQVGRAADGTLQLAWAADQGVLIDQGLTSSVSTVVAGGQTISMQQLVGERLANSVSVASVGEGSNMLGGAGADTLTLDHAANHVSGGRGDDRINLNSTGGAIVSMRSGDGLDRVSAVRRATGGSTVARNVLRLGAGIDGSQLQLYKTAATSYALVFNDAGDGVSFFAGNPAGGPIALEDWPFDTIELADGSVLTWQQILDRGLAPELPHATEGNDVLVLSPLADTVYGLGGDDHIEGLAGHDTLHGDAGNDTLIGGAGNDYLSGGSGVNTLIGGDGNDILVGGASAAFDTSDGGEGDDRYTFRWGYGVAVSGVAMDTSTTSNDTYTVMGIAGSSGAPLAQTWTIRDSGGIDQLAFSTPSISPANTRVRYTGTAMSLVSGNLTVLLEGAIAPDGTLDPDFGIESVVFSNGGTFSAAQLLAMTLQTTAGNDVVRGYSGSDTIDGGAGNDTLYGGAGNDALAGGAGDDSLHGEDGDDTLTGNDGNDGLYGGAGNDTLTGGAGNDSLYGGAGDDTLDAGAGGGLLIGGAGNDTYLLHAGDGIVSIGAMQRGSSENDGTDLLALGVDRAAVTISVEASASSAEEDEVVLRWNDGSTTARFLLEGGPAGPARAVEEIRFADGTTLDWMQFMASITPLATDGDDTIQLRSTDDAFASGDGNDTVYGRAGNDRLDGGNGNDILYGGAGNDVLIGGAGDDHIDGGSGFNTVEFGVGSGKDTVATLENGTNDLSFGSAIAPGSVVVSWQPTTYFRSAYTVGGFSQSLVWNADLSISLSNGNDSVAAEATNQVGSRLYGGSRFGIHTVSFQDGTSWDLQTLITEVNRATEGDDVLVDVADVDFLAGGEGHDTLYGLVGPNRLEGQGGNDTLYGGDQNDILIGGAGDDVIIGAAGLDTLRYARGDGNDTVPGSELGRIAIEFLEGITPSDITLTRDSSDKMTVHVAGGGSIVVGYVYRRDQAVAEMRFADGTIWSQTEVVDRLLTGGVAADRIVGFGSSDDLINGGPGNDRLEGGTGSDFLLGGEGDDTLSARGSYVSGGEYDHDVLDGGAGNDLLIAETGAVTYRFDNGFGNDRIGLPWVTRSPGRLDTAVFGPGISPADMRATQSGRGLVLSLASASDTIFVTNFFASETSTALDASTPLDRVEFADGTVWTAADLVARLAPAITATDDVIFGSADSDVIDALAGDDVVYAGAGNDVVAGSAGNDTLYGEDGDDVLIGGAGFDTLEGGAGDDRYEFDRGDGEDLVTDTAGSADTLAFGAGIAASDITVTLSDYGPGYYKLDVNDSDDSLVVSGIDTVRFNDGTVWTAAQIDQLARTVYGTDADDVMDGTAAGDRLFGLAGNDQLNGLAGDDWLDGGVGSDTMRGGTGNDTYIVDAAGDVVVESSGQGTDTVIASITWTLGSNVERLTLGGTAAINGTGNSQSNVLTGNGAANILNGGTGADTMIGGAGNDTYVVDSTGDVVTEALDEGTDLVQSRVSYTLSANVEQLTLTGTSASNGTGNSLDNLLTGNSANNTLTGNAGNDTLDGGAGTDTMRGGAGNDTYVVERSADVVSENANEGIDTVRSSVTWTLGSNLENLTLIGSSAINGTGNTLANALTGNGANNTLTGAAGADTLDGGLGTDTLIGGTGADRYAFNRGYGIDTVQENDATAGVKDRVEFAAGIVQGDVTFRRSSNNLEALLSGGTDKLIVKDWYLGTQYRVEEFAFDDGTVLTDAQVNNLVSAMAAFAPEASTSMSSTMQLSRSHEMLLASPHVM